MEEPKDSLIIEVLGLKASAFGRFPVIALSILAGVVVVSVAIIGPAQVAQIFRQDRPALTHDK